MKQMSARFLTDVRQAPVAVAATLVLLLGGSAAHAASDTRVLGKSGDIYRVTAGAYGDLFPDGGQAPGNADVLRLEVRRGTGAVEHRLVPGSESGDSDRTPSLFFDAATDRLYVVWSSSDALTLTRINLASFDGAGWSETIEVSGNIHSEKSAPRLAVTHDRFRLAGSTGEPSARTVLHVVWSEGTTKGDRVMYAPVVLVDGELATTWRRVHRLNDYVPQQLVDNPFRAAPGARLLSAPTVDAGAESNAVVIGFADSASGALVQLELATPATELSELADSVADYLESSNLCKRLANDEPGTLTSVAEAARVHIVIVGRRIHHRVLSPLSQGVRNVLISRAAELCAQGGVTSVSSAARVHIVIVGARAQEGELLKSTEAATHVLLAAAQPVDDGYVQHLARLRVKSARIAPAVGYGKPTIFTSPKGTAAVVVWENGTTLRYVETESGAADKAWSNSHTLRLGSDLSRSEAYALLRERARSLE